MLAPSHVISNHIVHSVLQDSRLNYVQQHAQRAGMDEDRLEDLRVAASRSSPMGDALDLCVRYTDEEALSRLGPKLTQLIRYGSRLPGNHLDCLQPRRTRATMCRSLEIPGTRPHGSRDVSNL